MASFSSIRFVGIDVSLASTGIAIYSPDDGRVGLYSIPTNSKEDVWDRQIRVVSQLYKWLRPFDVCCFESFGMIGKASASGKAIERLELSGMLKAIACLRTGLKCFVVHPKTLKRFIAADGNADKSKFLRALATRWAIVTTNDDMGDAAGLALAAAFLLYGPHKQLLVDWKFIRLTTKEQAVLSQIRRYDENEAAYDYIVQAFAQRDSNEEAGGFLAEVRRNVICGVA